MYQVNVELRYVAIPISIASYRRAEVQTLTLPSKLSGSTGLHWMMAPLKCEAAANPSTAVTRARSCA